jgi:predicted DNA-binding transcriptional regulator YafY
LPALESEVDGRVKRWRLPSAKRSRRASSALSLPIEAEDLAARRLAMQLLKRDNLSSMAGKLQRLDTKLRTAVCDAGSARLETDLEALAESDGLIQRPGPRLIVEPELMKTLRWAVLACRKLQLRYRAKGSRNAKATVVRPYGFLYGRKGYLIVSYDRRPATELRNLALASIEAATPLDTSFVRPRKLDLSAYARRSFGAFQEDPVEVVWRFSPEVAAEAQQFLFHPSQTFKIRADGSLDVAFRAGSLLEMMWHLVTWGDAVTVVRPLHLRRMLAEMCAWLAEHHRKDPSRRRRVTQGMT